MKAEPWFFVCIYLIWQTHFVGIWQSKLIYSSCWDLTETSPNSLSRSLSLSGNSLLEMDTLPILMEHRDSCDRTSWTTTMFELIISDESFEWTDWRRWRTIGANYGIWVVSSEGKTTRARVSFLKYVGKSRIVILIVSVLVTANEKCFWREIDISWI